jgi:hypothetical protein
VNVYETHDHSAVDKAVHEAEERERAITRALSSQASRRYSRAISIVLVSVGILLLLAGIAWRISHPVRNATEITLSDVERGYALSKNLDDDLDSENLIVKKFVIFSTYATGLASAPTLTTGVEFSDNLSFEPTSQWCYLEKDTGIGTSQTLFIESIGEDGERTRADFTEEIVSEFGLTQSLLSDLRNHCAFVD